MSQHRCPNCSGHGTVCDYGPGGYDFLGPKECPECKGTGYRKKGDVKVVQAHIRRALQEAERSLNEAATIAEKNDVSFIADNVDLDGVTLRYSGGRWSVYSDSEWRHSGCTIGVEDEIVSEWYNSDCYGN